jgi:hypothetical protein
MKINISNCNNLTLGSLSLFDDRLNIKDAIVGTIYE